jgi:hypothetical protein
MGGSGLTWERSGDGKTCGSDRPKTAIINFVSCSLFGAGLAQWSIGDWNRMINQQAQTEGDEGSERTAVQRLLGLAEGARLFRAGDGRLFARVSVGNRVEVYALRSGAFRDWLIGGHFREFGELPPAEAIRRVIGALEAFARFGGGAPQVFIRVGSNSAKEGAAYYIDLGDVTSGGMGRRHRLVGLQQQSYGRERHAN